MVEEIKEKIEVDEFAEKPEEVLDEADLKELEEVKKETEKRVNGNSFNKRQTIEEAEREALANWAPKNKTWERS